MGKWVIHNTKSGKKFISCPACNSVLDCDYQHIDENEFDYCPYCGEKIKSHIVCPSCGYYDGKKVI